MLLFIMSLICARATKVSQNHKIHSVSGILMAFSVFGPFAAIIIGGLFNRIPVDLQGKGSGIGPM